MPRLSARTIDDMDRMLRRLDGDDFGMSAAPEIGMHFSKASGGRSAGVPMDFAFGFNR